MAITVFNFVSTDGFFAGPNGEIDWFKAMTPDKEFEEFTHKNASTNSTLLFGRTTYEMMSSYWPTEWAIKSDPVMAKSVNESPKIVFSKTLRTIEESSTWKNITLLHDIDEETIRSLKDATILGSGSIVQQLAKRGLIDEYTLVVVPVILGTGKSLFTDIAMPLKLISSKTFDNGVVLLTYAPAK